ncbi:MAG: hypothetical protein KDK90_10420 [Leptospiraceae bacterium]|nr:hypothetical protein [Leptospiraceae bacterium]
MKTEIEEKLITFKMSGSTKTTLFGMIVLGILSFVGGFFMLSHETSIHGHSNPAWSALLVSTYFVLGIALIGVFYTAISHVTGAAWSVSFRRLTEAYGKFLPIGLILLVATFFGIHDLYEWSHSDVAAKDHLIHHKGAYLNANFFVIRLIIIGVIWSIFGYIFHKNSLKQDTGKNPEHTKFNAKLGGGFLVFFAASLSVASFDLLMSLTPHWFSTMFGVYCFAGLAQAGVGTFIIFIRYFKKNGYLGNLVNENHIHDLGKYLFGFCVFYAYIGFSQFMLIWYANMPEETFWYEQRMVGGWGWITAMLPFIKFIIPFLLLLNRPSKRDLGFLSKVAMWVVFTEVVELYWIVFPSNFDTFNVVGFLVTLGVVIGGLGMFIFTVLKSLESGKLIPVGDPRLEDCLHHHQ